MKARAALLCSEALGERVAGIGIRYLEMAARLPQAGIDVTLMAPGNQEDLDRLAQRLGVDTVRFERGRLASALDGHQCAVGQGQLMNDLLLECPELPVAVDLYDPWLIENMHYLSSLGLDPYRNDHATWRLQMSRGDLFLCSSDEQRLFYLGFLTALGRLNPRRLDGDPDAAKLIAIAPFGVEADPPTHRPLLEPSERPRLLFGGLYDWYDPWPVLEGIARLADDGVDCQLLLIRNPHAATPQRLLQEVETWARQRGANWIEFLDWVPYERRFDLLRDVDALVATHRNTVETRLSMRTRFLDALAIGCPIVTSEGGSIPRLLSEHDAGWVVAEGDAEGVASALREIFAGGDAVDSRTARELELARELSWERALQPVIEFCRDPWRDETKQDFAVELATRSPADPLGFRVKRRFRQLLEGNR